MYIKSGTLLKFVFAFLMCVFAQSAWAYYLYVYDYAGDLSAVPFDGTIDDLFRPSPGGPVTISPEPGEPGVNMFFLSDSGNNCSSSQGAREQSAISLMHSSGYAPLAWSIVQVTLADGNKDIWTRSGGTPAAQHYWDFNDSTCP